MKNSVKLKHIKNNLLIKFCRFIYALVAISILNTLIINKIEAQQICHSEDGTISISNDGFNQNVNFKQVYVLTNNNKLILQIKYNFTTPLFQNVASGDYLVYGINYEIDSGISGLEIGNFIRNIEGGCLEKSTGLPFNVCQPLNNCNAPNGIISFNSNGYQVDENFQQAYILTDENNIIVDIKYTPFFSNLSSGVYRVYSLNYDLRSGVNNLSIGQSIDTIEASCMDKKGPLIFEVCKEICDNGIDDDRDGKIDCADESCPEACVCDLTIALTPNIYHDANTPNDLADDTFTFEATINGTGIAGWEGGGHSGLYGETILFGPYPVGASGASFKIKDIVNEKCFTSVSANMSSCVYLETCTCCAKKD